MENLEHVALKHFTNEYLEVIKSFTIPENQLRYVTLPIENLEVEERKNRIVILHKDEPVGFFLMHLIDEVKEYSENSNAMLLTALTINHVQQRKGFAKKGMLLLIDFVKSEFPNCDEIVLLVDEENIPAQRLYFGVDFLDTGERKIGPIGKQIVMNYIIKKP